MEKYISFPSLTILANHLVQKYVNIPENMAAMIYKIQVDEVVANSNRSLIPKSDVAIEIGIYKINEKLNATSLFNP